jgi:hypothetical protein
VDTEWGIAGDGVNGNMGWEIVIFDRGEVPGIANVVRSKELEPELGVARYKWKYEYSGWQKVFARGCKYMDVAHKSYQTI